MTTMKKRIISIIACLCLTLGCIACGNQAEAEKLTAVTGDEFEQKAKDLAFFVYDQTEMTKADNALIDKAYVAFSKVDQNVTIEFDIYQEEQGAIDLYEYLTKSLEGGKDNFVNPVLTKTDHSLMLEAETDGYFYYVCRIDRTVYLSFIPYGSKDVAMVLARELGYN